MNWYVKSALGFFSIISLFLVCTIIFFTVIIDVNSLKPWITQWVKENKQRTLIIENDINLSFYPKLTLNLGPVSLSEYQQEKIFASVEKIQLSVSLLALLRRQFSAEGITIQGFHTTLIRFADGRTNFDDLIDPDEEPTTFTFDIDYVSIVDTHIILQDEISDKTLTFSDLDVETGRLKTGLFSDIRSNGSGLLVGINTTDSMTFGLNFEASQIQLNDGYMTSKPIHLHFNFTDSSNNITGKFLISDLTQTDNQLASNSIHFELTSQRDIQIVNASVEATLVGLTDKQHWTLPDISAAFNFSNPEGLDPPINGRLSGDLVFNPQTETLQMNYTGELADSPFHADCSLINFSEKILNLNFYIDQLNLNNFISPQTSQQLTNKKQPEQSTDPLDISFLKNLNMTGLIHIGQLQIGDIQSTDIQLQIQPAASTASTE